MLSFSNQTVATDYAMLIILNLLQLYTKNNAYLQI